MLFSLENMVIPYFLVESKILLYKSGTIICPFSVKLKHKCSLTKEDEADLERTQKSFSKLVLGDKYVDYETA